MRTVDPRLIAALLLGMSPASAQEAAPPPRLEHAFDLTVRLGAPVKAGETAIGERVMVPILGGTVSGPAIRGQILPGGWDWQLIRRDGCIGITADYMLRTDDGVTIKVGDTGVNCLPTGAGEPPYTHPVFEVQQGKYDWLGRTAFVGSGARFTDAQGAGLKIAVYRVR